MGAGDCYVSSICKCSDADDGDAMGTPVRRWCAVIPFNWRGNWNGRIFGEQDASFRCFSAIVPSVFGHCWILLDFAGFFFWILLDFAGFCWILAWILTTWWFFQHLFFRPWLGSALRDSFWGRSSDPPLSPEFFVIKSSHSKKLRKHQGWHYLKGLLPFGTNIPMDNHHWYPLVLTPSGWQLLFKFPFDKTIKHAESSCISWEYGSL